MVSDYVFSLSLEEQELLRLKTQEVVHKAVYDRIVADVYDTSKSKTYMKVLLFSYAIDLILFFGFLSGVVGVFILLLSTIWCIFCLIFVVVYILSEAKKEFLKYKSKNKLWL